jgi:hypothetical protein
MDAAAEAKVAPDFPLVLWRYPHRAPAPELARDPNRERQSRYCQGFDPDWWVPATLAPKWRSMWYPLKATQEAVEQWLKLIDKMRVEHLGPFDSPEVAAEMKADRDSDLALIREIRPDLLPAPAAGPIAAYKRERDAMDHAWTGARAEGKTKDDAPSSAEEQILGSIDHANRRDALIAKHFPSLNLLDINSVDCIPALWAFVVLGIEKSALAESMVGPRVHANKLHAVYKAMHKLGIPWAPEPPYDPLPEDQALDKLYFIANRLEREERASALDAQENGGARTPPSARCSHAPGFSSVEWFGVHHEFAKGLQAESVRLLWEAWEKGGHSLSEKTIGEEAGSGSDRFRLYHVFAPKDNKTGKRTRHLAWGTMIQQAGKGKYRLVSPESAKPTETTK